MMDKILNFIHENATLINGIVVAWFGYKATTASNLSKKQYEDITGKIDNIDQIAKSNRCTLKEQGDTLALVKGGVLGNRRRNLYRDLKAAIERGYTTLEERRELALLFEGYEKLGGNGEIATMYQIYVDLEVKGD